LSAKVTRNVVYNGARLFLLAPLPFVMVPFLLKKLGTSGYGTWAVFLAISSTTSLADIGLVTTLSKYVAEYFALRDFRALSQLMTTGLILYLVISCLFAGILWTSSPLLLPALFHGSPAPIGDLRVLWHYLILLVVANVMTLPFSSVVIGLQRMDLSTAIGSLNVLSSAGLSVVLLSRNLGLRGILCAYALVAWISLFAYIYTLRRLLSEVKLDSSACS
jgi:O-antigen/teichoic acid export membrane protein